LRAGTRNSQHSQPGRQHEFGLHVSLDFRKRKVNTL
jgi:hypothetical protein